MGIKAFKGKKSNKEQRKLDKANVELIYMQICNTQSHTNPPHVDSTHITPHIILKTPSQAQQRIP